MNKKFHERLRNGNLVWLILISTLCLLQAPLQAGTAGEIWSDVAPKQMVTKYGLDSLAPHHRTVSLSLEALGPLLVQAPAEGVDKHIERPTLPLPLPDGGWGLFALETTPVMAPELAAKFPQIQTFRAVDLDNPARVAYLDLSPHGFHGMILAPGEAIFINPLAETLKTSAEIDDTVDDTTNVDWYTVFHKRDHVSATEVQSFSCLVDDSIASTSHFRQLEDSPKSANKMSTGAIRRVYRAAIATTGEYTQFHGGTVAAGLAAVVTAVNRLNGLFRRELSIALNLVANNDQIIFTNPTTDPYTNSDPFAMLNQNRTTLDTTIGVGAYDHGHVFGTMGGGVAQVRSPCANDKAEGVSAIGMPVGDPFVVDYVAHEMGHQFGALHSFNGSTGSCGGNRTPSAAYEPGSGSTIMGYTGICGGENLQINSDPNFHSISFDEITAYVHQGGGNRCGTGVSTGNAAPSVNAGINRTIPARTPFTLTGNGSDSQSLAFSWEQFDLGAVAPPNTDNGNRPIFRSYPPTSSRSRTFPRLGLVLTGSERLGESLPTTSRNLTYRLTARDGQGGVRHDTVVLQVAGNAGPFQVTSPAANTVWTAGATETVEWNVARTDLAPVNCNSVDLLLSTNGGNSFPLVLAEGVPNSGLQTITVPDNLTGDRTRVKVACADNVFFAISRPNFTIRGESTCTPDERTLCLDNNRFKVTIDWRNFDDEVGVGQLVTGADSPDSGLFYFFAPDNWEMLVKVLNGCSFNNHYWVFAAATTNVEYTLRVVDTQSGEVASYTNSLGQASEAITDTEALNTCP